MLQYFNRLMFYLSWGLLTRGSRSTWWQLSNSTKTHFWSRHCLRDIFFQREPHYPSEAEVLSRLVETRPGPDPIQKNSGVDFYTRLELTNHINHVTNCGFSNWSNFSVESNFTLIILYRIASTGPTKKDVMFQCSDHCMILGSRGRAREKVFISLMF